MRLIRTSLPPALAVVAVCVIVAAVVQGSAGALGAGIGGLLVCGLFLMNPPALGPVTKVMPQVSLAVALLFFATKLLLVLALLTLLLDPAGIGGSVDDRSLVASVVVLSLTWVVLLVRDHRHARLPIYDLRDESSDPADRFGSQ